MPLAGDTGVAGAGLSTGLFTDNGAPSSYRLPTASPATSAESSCARAMTTFSPTNQTEVATAGSRTAGATPATVADVTRRLR